MEAENPEEPVIAAVRAKVEEALATWKAIGATPLPKSLKEARDTKWSLASDAVEIGSLMSYPEELQSADGKRALRLEKAIAIVEAFERELVAQMVVRPENVASKVKSTVEKVGKVALETIKTIWRFGGAKAFWIIIREMVQHIFVTIGSGILIVAITKAANTRRSIEREMRKAALPQRLQVRYVRRKISRR